MLETSNRADRLVDATERGLALGIRWTVASVVVAVSWVSILTTAVIAVLVGRGIAGMFL